MNISGDIISYTSLFYRYIDTYPGTMLKLIGDSGIHVISSATTSYDIPYIFVKTHYAINKFHDASRPAIQPLPQSRCYLIRRQECGGLVTNMHSAMPQSKKKKILTGDGESIHVFPYVWIRSGFLEKLIFISSKQTESSEAVNECRISTATAQRPLSPLHFADFP